MPRRPTLRDVATRAGVHQATASRALNPALPGRVTAATAERVRAAARELGYVPDPTARSLRTRRSGVVGVVVPDLANPVLPPIVRGIERVLWSAGLACLLADTDNDPEREAVHVAELRARRCEGLIVATAARTSPTVSDLLGAELPAVLVTREIDGGGLPFVAADDAAGTAAAVAHLVALGHQRIAHVTGPLDLSTTMTRLEAFRAALVSASLPLVESLVVHGDAFTTAAGERAAERLPGRAFTAIVAGNDMIALGVIAALRRAGVRCPEDVSVTGHNDMPLVDRVDPPLTTVAIPQDEIGAAAARLLLERIDGGGGADASGGAAPAGRADTADADAPPRVLLPTRLIVRASTAPAR
ncbi:LacI family DNA-binding transcriptional regulator [Conexibacter sp. CPCC 206217]|uniref:LacI family DNA-binding transcriptional regulator n=1 Tax=Conexibacter sp. CPCC 206217 TaxID=3064574 RepID=UPI002719A025|nr:LacI family DNA-binding transcriptional regulator [Conexibacter sp. CPCC 206217]MDO8212513.1 LacI family DNA-binding transcriptional regulator [Conexibacter sp. CPCC 206217]